MRLLLIGLVGVIVLAALRYQGTTARTGAPERLFHINSGESVRSIAHRLEADGIIYSRWFFLFSVWEQGVRGKTQAGDYLLNGTLTVPEIVFKLTNGGAESLSVTITFPEGWDSRKMAERLTASNLPGADFLALVQHSDPKWWDQFPFLRTLPANASLEGFLFPDTYSFFKTATAEDIIAKMLGNFQSKFVDVAWNTKDLKAHSLFDTVIMASIVENEVTTSDDRKLVADLFWRRIANGQRLESDATVKYVLRKNKIQHSFEETRVDSPYNTYTHEGLPPGPIGNPGVDALAATLHPTPNRYVFFLSDPVTGETIFAQTFDEHIRNKAAHGL